MPTTFTGRETVRDAIAALFTAYNVSTPTWAKIYGYLVPVNQFIKKSPVLMIVSFGSETVMRAEFTNPTDFRFMITNSVLVYSGGDNWDSADASDKLDELNTISRQIIRNNAGGITGACDSLRFEGESTISYQMRESKLYGIESFSVIAKLTNGSM